MEIKKSLTQFRPFHSQVKKKDKLTTKICETCFDKINEFVLFREKCAATNVQLRTASSHCMLYGSTGAVRKTSATKGIFKARDQPFETISANGDDEAVATYESFSPVSKT